MPLLKLKSILILIIVLNTSAYYSQSYFNKLFGLPKPYADIAVPAAIEIEGEGYIHSYLPWNYQNGEMQIIFQKLNYQGDTLWRNVYGKSGFQYASTYIIKANDNNYVMGGYTYTLNDTTMYFYLLKVKSNGDSIWSKKYPPLIKARIVNVHMVKQTIDGGYILCGARQPYSTTGNPLPADIFIVKTDSLGNMQWRKQYGGIGHDVATSVIETPDKNFYIGGYSSGSPGSDSDTYLLKIDSIGTFLWDTVYGEWGYNDGSNKMIQLKDGNFLLAGEINYNSPGPNNGKAMLIKITPKGSVIWGKKYGGVEMTTLNSVIELPGGEIVAVGGNNNTTKYNQAGWIIKTDVNGDSLWARVFDYLPGFPSLFYGITPTKDKGFIITGSANDTTSSKSQQAWVLKVDSMGCDVAGCQFVGVKEQQAPGTTIKLFPNPSNGSFTISSETALKRCIVMDVLGNVVYYDGNISSTLFDIPLSQLSNGIYFLKVKDVHDVEQVQKVIIEH